MTRFTPDPTSCPLPPDHLVYRAATGRQPRWRLLPAMRCRPITRAVTRPAGQVAGMPTRTRDLDSDGSVQRRRNVGASVAP